MRYSIRKAAYTEGQHQRSLVLLAFLGATQVKADQVTKQHQR